MTYLKKAALLCMLALCTIARGQINFEPGYFITNDGTRTECLIKNIGWKNNPENFTYKTAENAEPKEGALADIAAFEVGGYKYIRFTVKMERSSTLANGITDNKKPQWKTETLYLQLLVEGPVNLYSYEGGNIVKYFISAPPHKEATQLLHILYFEDRAVKENDGYKQQLYILMQDKYDLKTFERLAYNKEKLVKLFLAYNGEKGEKVTNHTLKQSKSSFNLKITPGASLATLKVNEIPPGTAGAYTVHLFKSAPVIRIGFEAECILPFNNNKWALFTDPNIQFYKKDDTVATQSVSSSYSGWDAQYTFLEIPLGARYYMFLNPKSKIFVNAAYVFSVECGDNFVRRDKSSSLKIGNTSNFSVGGGYSYAGRYSAELRYTFSHDTLEHLFWSASYSSIGLVLGCKIL